MSRPDYYGTGAYECIKVIRAYGWLEGMCKGNALKYLARAGKKDDEIEDMKKARQYMDFWIEELEGDNDQPSLFKVYDKDKEVEDFFQALVDEQQDDLLLESAKAYGEWITGAKSKETIVDEFLARERLLKSGN